MTKKMILQNFFYNYLWGKHYWINVQDIIIPNSFKKTPPRTKKLNKKIEYYRKTNKFESEIVLNDDFVLVDGYTSYIIAREYGVEFVKVVFK